MQWGDQRFVGISGHLPHHATVVQTGTILDSWSTQISRTHRGILGWDANETFILDNPDDKLTSCSARKEYILNWMEENNLLAPDQQLEKPTNFPYNQRMQPRRLEYLLLKHLSGANGPFSAKETWLAPTMSPSA